MINHDNSRTAHFRWQYTNQSYVCCFSALQRRKALLLTNQVSSYCLLALQCTFVDISPVLGQRFVFAGRYAVVNVASVSRRGLIGSWLVHRLNDCFTDHLMRQLEGQLVSSDHFTPITQLVYRTHPCHRCEIAILRSKLVGRTKTMRFFYEAYQRVKYFSTAADNIWVRKCTRLDTIA